MFHVKHLYPMHFKILLSTNSPDSWAAEHLGHGSQILIGNGHIPNKLQT